MSHLKDWCVGRLSGPDLGRHALAYVADHGKNGNAAIMGALHEFAWKGGNNGLLKRMPNIRFTKLIERVTRSVVTEIVPPHSLMGVLAKHTTVFRRHVGANVYSLLSFWGGLYKSSAGRQF